MLLIQSILVYTLLALLMFFFSKKAFSFCGVERKIYDYIPLLLFVFIFGLRYSVGVDWENYREVYEDELMGMSFVEMLNARYEIGFIFIIYLCYFFQFPVYMLFVIISALQIIFLYKALKDEEALPYIYLTLIFTGVAVQGFCNVMRQDVAFCIFLYALKYVKERRLLPYLLFCGLAFCFHKSAVVLFPIYFFWSVRTSIFKQPILQISLFLGCVVLSFFDPIQKIFENIESLIVLLGYEDYIDIVYDLEINSFLGPTRLLIIFVNIVIIWHSNNIKLFYDSKLLNIFYDLFIIGICCNFLFLGSMMFLRISLFFTNFAFILYGYALLYFLKSPKTKANLFGLVVLFLSLFVSYMGLMRNVNNTTDAYVFYFQKELHSLKDQQRDMMLYYRL